MTYNFCTLFDKKYVYQGLALHDSLLEHCPDFKLWILCLDKETFDLLTKLNLKETRLIPLASIEGTELLAAKNNRSYGEYCWTLASAFTYYLLQIETDLNNLAYLDSDLYFYSSPQAIYDELGDGSGLIIKHNYTPKLKYLEKNGLYNVAMVIFKNNPDGRDCLKQWRNECLKWCYNKNEDGKFGDQLYLNSWPAEFRGIRILKHPGGGVAPWNIGRYLITAARGRVLIDGRPLIFYHFHTFKITGPESFEPHSSFYKTNQTVKNLIYEPYIQNLKILMKKVESSDPTFTFGFRPPENLPTKIKQKIKKFLVLIYFSHKKYDSKN